MPAEFKKLYRIRKQIGIGTTSRVFRISPNHTLGSNYSHDLALKMIDKRKLTLGMEEADTLYLLNQLRREVEVLKHLNQGNKFPFRVFRGRR
jgi:serine/threonine protein kinase